MDSICVRAYRGSYVTCVGVHVVFHVLCFRKMFPDVVLSLRAVEMGVTKIGLGRLHLSYSSCFVPMRYVLCG